MSKKRSMSTYNETHLLLSLGLLAMLVILPTFYNVGPSSASCALPSLNSVEKSSLKNTTTKLDTVKNDKTRNLFIPSAIPIIAKQGPIKKKDIVKKTAKLEAKKVVGTEKKETKVAKKAEPSPELPTIKNSKSKVYFAFNSFTLPARIKTDLKPVLNYLKENKSAKVGLKGFHDNVGADYIIYNKRIALKRAQQVYNFLLAQGISADRVILQKPEKSLGTGSNWEARRVEAYIIE